MAKLQSFYISKTGIHVGLDSKDHSPTITFLDGKKLPLGSKEGEWLSTLFAQSDDCTYNVSSISGDYPKFRITVDFEFPSKDLRDLVNLVRSCLIATY